ncbi:unnamed protein product [Eruca vesicaria subsp. sativa]|uniref:Uncharacterized protein n=1 Tax=Eruca vesicaria subsp. sativa TaxID=29727 RepID=A0ABC8LWZ0_ERUVS|nr:unnamed protein product [Eruca vesicaria subsp. sativa]
MSVRAIISLVVLVILIESHESTPIPDGLRKVEEAFVKILGQSSHVLSFARFTHQYGKMYQNEEEIKQRFSVFKENLDFIRSTNKKGLSYKLGVNQYADLTREEFQRNKIGASQHPFATSKGSRRLTGRALLQTSAPSAKDWREDGVVSPVKNQGAACAASWAISATGAVESAYHIKHGVGRDLSVQQLIDCSSSHGTLGCIDGHPFQAFNYIKSEGINNATQYPYLGVQGVCRSNSDSVVNVTGYVAIPSFDELELMKAVGSIGPVSVSFGVSLSLQHYSSGVYHSSEHCEDILGIRQYGLAVGYGNEAGRDYWIIKNSWGEQWGDGGYFKFERGRNLCGIAVLPVYPIVD